MTTFGRPHFNIIGAYLVPSRWDPERLATATKIEATAYTLAWARYLAQRLHTDWDDVAIRLEGATPEGMAQLDQAQRERLLELAEADIPF